MRVLIVSTFKSWVQPQLRGCWLPEPKGTVPLTGCTCLQGNQQPRKCKNKQLLLLPLVHAPELGQAAAPHQGSPKRTPAFIYNTPQVTYHRKERVQYNSRTQQRKGIGSPKSLQPSPQPLVLHRPGSPIPASSEHRRAGGCQPSHRAAQQLGWAKLTQPLSLAQAETQEPSTQCQERVAKGRTPGEVPPLRHPGRAEGPGLFRGLRIWKMVLVQNCSVARARSS